MRFRMPGGKSPIAVVVMAVILIGTASAFAASGAGALVTGGDNGGVNARGSQQPLGSASAAPPPPVAPPNQSGTAPTNVPPGRGATNVPTPPNQGVGSDVSSKPGTPKAVAVKPATASSKAVGGGGGGTTGGNLPFTGFLAIPVLLVGAALLLVGYGLRRRAPSVA